MDSPQTVIMESPPNSESKKINGAKEVDDVSLEEIPGVLEVCIHQARDIHNICIYHKQDVYAKLSLTSNPETTVSSKIINGGGRNPVFDETLRLDVRTLDSSLKCEMWMLSRVKNYLQDQLLGFALVHLSEVIINNGKLEREFSLSSSDLFHSPAGFVQLSLSYAGISPEVMKIPKSLSPVEEDYEISELLTCDLVNIEFPDPNIVKEDQIMVSEYFSSSENKDRFVGFERESNTTSEEIGEGMVECISKSTSNTNSPALPLVNPPPSSNSTPPASLNSPETPSPENISASEESEMDSNQQALGDHFTSRVIDVKVEPEQPVVQQDIIDMYMKSMQQFTDSLAKMKLPLDIENGPAGSENSSSDQKSNGSKVFYGSRAFF